MNHCEYQQTSRTASYHLYPTIESKFEEQAHTSNSDNSFTGRLEDAVFELFYTTPVDINHTNCNKNEQQSPPSIHLEGLRDESRIDSAATSIDTIEQGRLEDCQFDVFEVQPVIAVVSTP